MISVAAFIFLLLFDPYSPSLSFVVMGTTAYVAFMASPWGLVRQALLDIKSVKVQCQIIWYNFGDNSHDIIFSKFDAFN